ncbi:MAG: DoxX family membrane protein [Dehalococcoidales bacterium]|nr:DoxX family membrane protein [Dehalococcoidales bacterium]
MSAVMDVKGRELRGPSFLSAPFSDTRFTVLWLVIRLFVGYQWLNAGLHKLESAAWMGDGTALAGYWTKAVATQPTAPITYDWYRGFLQMLLDGGHYAWFAKLIVFGEMAVGIALILGAFVGVAAFFGAFMNLNFMLAGSLSTNPGLFVLAIFLVAAWKIAGYLGADFFILRYAGAIWQPQRTPTINLKADQPSAS